MSSLETLNNQRFIPTTEKKAISRESEYIKIKILFLIRKALDKKKLKKFVKKWVKNVKEHNLETLQNLILQLSLLKHTNKIRIPSYLLTDQPTHPPTYLSSCTHTCTYTLHTCIHTHVHTHIHAYTHAYICRYTHIQYIHACMHTHNDIQILKFYGLLVDFN